MSGNSTGDRDSMAERWRRSQLETAKEEEKVEQARAVAPEPSSDTPARCPACGSSDILTTGKAAADAYWRCCGCGEVWNAGRLRSASRNSRNGFRR